jgi:hypothetical protein
MNRSSPEGGSEEPPLLPISGIPKAALLLLMLGCASGAGVHSGIQVSEGTLFGDLDCFRIETPSATYVYGKRGAGFASILDPEGRDWISYRHGGKAAGEYRGLPKCGQPVKFFHCGYGYGQYKNDQPFSSRLAKNGPDHVRIESETADGRSACAWEFTPDHATFTLLRIAQPTFWFLYEGTPGGTLEPHRGFALRPGGQRTTLAEPWEDRIPWVCFGVAESSYGLLLVSHDAETTSASYVAWPYKPEPDGGYRQMTVFGWGRLGWQDSKQHEPQLRELPAHFSIAVTRGVEESVLARTADRLARSR